MKHPRLYKRVAPSGLVSKRAQIVVGPKAPLIDCTVIDYSAGGACLGLGGAVQLPQRFEIIYGGVRKRCRLVWQKGLRLGVAF
ncbi:MAG: PilZ domain-containing protein [Xanthobacteraceae bacterium]|nr:PilZ domain-containing protein [Xanthobacteraceae bacterium]